MQRPLSATIPLLGKGWSGNALPPLQVGVHLSKELMAIAGRSLKANITTLAPLVLPLSEQALFLANRAGRKVLHLLRSPLLSVGWREGLGRAHPNFVSCVGPCMHPSSSH